MEKPTKSVDEEKPANKLGDIAFQMLKEVKELLEEAPETKAKILVAVDIDTGAIDLAFSENHNPEYDGQTVFSPSYYTLSGKERLILLFAENFRRQFQQKYPTRPPLVLAVKNECKVQKFVSTTIRPTAFLIAKLIGSLEECAKFVADYIIYEPLSNPIALPPRLISPDTLLRSRKGNSFEMATLLCSMLTGAGFAALVASGRATREKTLNDQRNVDCPYIPKSNICEDENEQNERLEQNKYTLKEPPDLRSRFAMFVEQQTLQQQENEIFQKEQTERNLQNVSDENACDPVANRRIHAWVVVIENAPWSCKRYENKIINENGEDVLAEPTAYFIEPATGFRHSVSDPDYLSIESIWNQYNYYINTQNCSLAETRWDLANVNDWEHFLSGEPYELRKEDMSLEEVDPGHQEDDINKEKHLDLIPSWVQQLHIGLQQFEERYPNNEKSIHYKKAIYTRFSPYFRRDGMSSKLTLYEDNEYQNPITRWEWYENREDYLDMIKIDFRTKQIEEIFVKGRADCLKFYEHSAERDKSKIFHFYYLPRFDSLRMLHLSKDRIALHFEERDDLCYYREYLIKSIKFENSSTKPLSQIIEKYRRNSKLPSNKDIAIRRYNLYQNEIFLKYHYAKDAITASTRKFIKPPKPDYGQEIIFDPDSTSGYKANEMDPSPTKVELYLLLLSELANEDKLKKAFEKQCEEIDVILNKRKTEMVQPRLVFSVFDPLRNQGARKIKVEQYENMKRQKELAAMQDADFLASYLVLYEGRQPDYEESWAAYHACLNDVKTRYVNLLNDLQRRYEELTSEAKALKKFLSKFQDQFDDFDYERLVKEGKDIELNRRMVQQRLILCHEEAERKYEQIKASLLKDKRLNLHDPTLIHLKPPPRQ